MTERLIPHRRILAARGQAHVPREFLESLFTAELLRPSRRLFLVSPWISDIAVIQNLGRRYASLDPTWEAGEVWARVRSGPGQGLDGFEEIGMPALTRALAGPS